MDRLLLTIECKDVKNAWIQCWFSRSRHLSQCDNIQQGVKYYYGFKIRYPAAFVNELTQQIFVQGLPLMLGM